MEDNKISLYMVVVLKTKMESFQNY